ncbi:hypothetical protein F4801DRAFT_593694 [Xylaria longipes]|nr:hypothetical protein F4801DRAFT_593694 [Xylaria longipes]
MIDCQFTVSSQADVNIPSLLCGTIDIRGATGTLNFTNVSVASTITVYDSPGLEVMSFPQLNLLNRLEISDATALSTVSFPTLFTIPGEGTVGTNVFPGPYLDVNITHAPNLTSIEWNLTYCRDLVLFGLPRSVGLGTDNITAALNMQTDSCLTFSSLDLVDSLQVSAWPWCNYGLENLRSIGNFTATNNGGTSIVDLDPYDQLPPIQINHTMIVESSTAYTDPLGRYDSEIAFGRISAVADDLIITSNSDLYIGFGGLTGVGSSLSVSKNTNCTFKFDQVSTVGSLILQDNVATVLPLFPRLERVGDIHLRGYIDTSSGPHIFPALTLASGSVVIEAWNADFDYSELVSQWKDNLIHTLACNGTGNGTDTPSPSPNPSRPAQLSVGALAGIGVSAGIFGVAVIAAITWLCLRFRRQLRALETAQRLGAIGSVQKSTEEVSRPDVSGLHEADPTGMTETLREKPDDHLPISRVKAELPDDHIVELQVGEAKLPASPQRLASE